MQLDALLIVLQLQVQELPLAQPLLLLYQQMLLQLMWLLLKRPMTISSPKVIQIWRLSKPTSLQQRMPRS
ncbi:MAG: hypothetical protein EBU43_07225, partial [Actinobacteria bacterium]|nr:hypothetical protein [Actinomycetota bacterium]